MALFKISLGVLAALTCACAPKFNHSSKAAAAAKTTPTYSAFDTSSQSGGRATSVNFMVTHVESVTSVHVNTATAGGFSVRGGIYGAQ